MASNPALYHAVLDAMSAARDAQRLELEKQKAVLEAQLAELDCSTPPTRRGARPKSQKSQKRAQKKPPSKARFEQLVQEIRALIKSVPKNRTGTSVGKPNQTKIVQGLGNQWRATDIAAASKVAGCPIHPNHVSYVRHH